MREVSSFTSVFLGYLSIFANLYMSFGTWHLSYKFNGIHLWWIRHVMKLCWLKRVELFILMLNMNLITVHISICQMWKNVARAFIISRAGRWWHNNKQNKAMIWDRSTWMAVEREISGVSVLSFLFFIYSKLIYDAITTLSSSVLIYEKWNHTWKWIKLGG